MAQAAKGPKRPEVRKKISETLANKQQWTREQCLARVPSKPLLTTEDVARIFDVHQVTVYKWVTQGDLPASRMRAFSKANVYKREDVIALVNRRYEIRPAQSVSSKGVHHESVSSDRQAQGQGGKPKRRARAGK